jgi:purine-binding chemotaxis protein CheW
VELKVVSFKLGDEEFALDIMKIHTVIEYGKIMKIPNSAEYVEGIMNSRGSVIPIVNLRKRFGMQDIDNKSKAKIIVIKYDQEKKVGFLVDDVREVITLNNDEIEEPPSYLSSTRTDFILGVAKLEDNMILILDADKLLTNKEKIDLASLTDKQ